ncbi:hypothetical protein [Anaeromyxobacter oryzae]|uniref:Alginate export domain-containing protein n=1 Tax=Anaeromyxobacter oryzae TaxID=2918170 RepID=A0ABM7WZI5_9BACT|nr:hypothetical protein [Anaeromyxobacter oryzae]BDG04863.1 hypothetical protein AMOR_38590 [Anaeromyxobacter oryzae]
MRHTKLIAAALVLLAGATVRADTVDVSSTTLVTGGQQTRFTGGTKLDLVTVVPAYEILSVVARDVTNPVASDLQLVLAGWGAYDFDHLRWDNGTSSNLNGDLQMGYVQGKLLNRQLTLRIGREQVQTGVARMIHIDGGEAIVLLPAGFRVSGYVGAPVSQRFQSRSGLRSWNPEGGDLAYGGRLAYSLPIPGVPGRGLDIGASANFVEDGGDPVRQEVGGDLRLQPIGNLTLLAFGAYSLYDDRFSEASVMGTWTPIHKLHLSADWHFFAPDLFLARNSVLSVFSASDRNEFGGGLTYELGRGLSVGADYHLQLEPGATEESGHHIGHDANARLDWSRGATVAGAEFLFLDALENGYWGGRLYGRQSFGKLFAAADVIGHVFREKVNNETYAVTGTLSAGLELARGFSAVISGRAGVTPFLEQTYDVMAKLVYNQTYVRREVR